MSEDRNLKDARRIADGLSGPQREVLLVCDDDKVRGGIGTWFLLRAAGLLDGDFNVTELGQAVRAALAKAAE